MSPEAIRGKLIGVLESIQVDSGLECPVLTGQSKPLEELPKFDSKVWPVAIALIAVELGVAIDDDVNIFRKEKACDALSIDETVALLTALAEKQEKIEKRAASKK